MPAIVWLDLFRLEIESHGDVFVAPENSALSVTFQGITGLGTPAVGVTSSGLGGDSISTDFLLGDDNDEFEAAGAITIGFGGPTSTVNESITLSFNQTISVTGFDLAGISGKEAFQFGPISLTDADTGGSSGDLITLATPVVIPANTNILIQATSGAVGIEGVTFDIVESASVPEPSSACLLVGLGLCGLMRRRR